MTKGPSACNLDQLNFRSRFRVKKEVGEQRPKNPKSAGWHLETPRPIDRTDKNINQKACSQGGLGEMVKDFFYKSFF